MYFPDEGMLSVTIGNSEGRIVEIAMIGREGASISPVVFTAEGQGLRVVVQIAASGHQMPLSEYRRLSSENATFRELNDRYSQVLIAMIAQSALCLATHAVEERLARWLLTTADRVGAETFLLTQEFLGQMLGVQRPTVSEAASGLRGRQIISYTRGRITIHDREALTGEACECYGVMRAEIDALGK